MRNGSDQGGKARANQKLELFGAAGSNSVTLFAGGNVGLITLPLSVAADDGFGTVDFTGNRAVAFVSYVFGSFNESSRGWGFGADSVLSSNVGSIPSSCEERASFKLDSSQFPTESRIFSIGRIGILPPEDPRE